MKEKTEIAFVQSCFPRGWRFSSGPVCTVPGTKFLRHYDECPVLFLELAMCPENEILDGLELECLSFKSLYDA